MEFFWPESFLCIFGCIGTKNFCFLDQKDAPFLNKQFHVWVPLIVQCKVLVMTRLPLFLNACNCQENKNKENHTEIRQVHSYVLGIPDRNFTIKINHSKTTYYSFDILFSNFPINCWYIFVLFHCSIFKYSIFSNNFSFWIEELGSLRSISITFKSRWNRFFYCCHSIVKGLNGMQLFLIYTVRITLIM